MKKKLLTTFLLASFLLLLQNIIVMAGTIPEGYYRFRNVNSDLYLDSNGTADNSNIRQLQPAIGFLPQKFLVMDDGIGDEHYTIELYGAPNKVLDVQGASTADGGNVVLYTSNGTNAQKWKFISNGDGSFRIGAKCTQDQKVLTVQNASLASGVNIYQYSYSSNKNAAWYVEAAVEDATYLIRNTKTGLYLTANGTYVKQSEYSDSNYQKFKIKGDNNGYYDIMPLSDLALSLTVEGSTSGNDKEGALILSLVGQSDEGQSWRFLLNADGSYRIVSQISNCKKAMTVKSSNNNTSVYSNTYSVNNNANWELIRVNPTENTESFQKVGRNIIVDLDTKAYLKNNISPKNLTRWINHLDQAYDLYYDLVGLKPASGKKVRIVAGDKTVFGEDGKNYVAWCWPNDDKIYYEKTEIAKDMKYIDQNDDWSFGMLHEMSHLFDIQSKWVFHDELSANFKMAYVLYQLDGNFRVFFDGMMCTRYQQIFEGYQDTANIYFDTKNKYKFNNDVVTHMLLNTLGNNGWTYMKQAYRDYNGRALSSIPSNVVEKYHLFLNVIDAHYPNKLFLKNYNAKYGSFYNATIEDWLLHPEDYKEPTARIAQPVCAFQQ